MVIRQILMAIIGMSAGVVVSAGVFALITSTGLMPRLAGRTHTAKHVRMYESCVIWGGILGNIFWIYNISFKIPHLLSAAILILFGSFAGIFVGCLATSLAEALNTTAIFTRRTKLKMGLCIIVVCLGIGKALGSCLQFIKDWGI
ncbi:MAG: stage V sporulation protein AB [Eubacterium sp.]